MKYLKYFESFYSPVTQVYKSNIGNDSGNDTGANTYPLNSFSVNDEDKAFAEGEKAFGKDESNPYLNQQYPNSTLIKAFNDGLQNAKRNKLNKE
jgi:hypothetical protein